MSAPSLTSFEQRSAISGKKKKTVKNILGIPEGSKMECYSVDSDGVRKLHEILNRLLPFARLPFQPNPKFNKNSVEQAHTDPEVKEKAKIKRNQLSLGVNTLNKNIKKNLISAALLASDIQPKFLTNHLNLLCHHNEIPFLYIPQLREITAVSLGFPCIAIGFKKDSSDYSEAVEKIKALYQTKKMQSHTATDKLKNDNKSKTEVVSHDFDEMETPIQKCPQPVTPFVYLYRNSVKERAFVPESESGTLTKNKSKSDFISVKKQISELNHKRNVLPWGISSNLIKKQQKATKSFEHVLKSSFNDDDDEEDLEVPKKKAKKDWVIDKMETKKKYKYEPAKLYKIPSNTNRNSKNK